VVTTIQQRTLFVVCLYCSSHGLLLYHNRDRCCFCCYYYRYVVAHGVFNKAPKYAIMLLHAGIRKVLDCTLRSVLQGRRYAAPCVAPLGGAPGGRDQGTACLPSLRHPGAALSPFSLHPPRAPRRRCALGPPQVARARPRVRRLGAGASRRQPAGPRPRRGPPRAWPQP